MIYLQLLFTFAFIGLFSFGGGYAMIPLIQKEIVTVHGWLTLEQFTDIIAVSQSTPGPLAVNAATYVGYQTSGLLGATVATLGLMLPAFVLIISLANLLMRHKDKPMLQAALYGLRPVVVALIVGSALSMIPANIVGFGGIVMGVVALALSCFTKIHPVLVLLGCGILGIFFL